MTIDALSWQWATGGTSAGFNNFVIILGHTDRDELGNVFDENYLPGTDVRVYSTSYAELKVGTDGWVTIDLQTDFDYNGTDNLVMEIQWSAGSGSLYTYAWDTGTDRLLRGASPSSATGQLGSGICQFMIGSTLALEQSTFGSIKAELGSM